MNARLFPLLFALALARPVAAQSLLITEFGAVNNGAIRDETGRTSDWIEIYNTATTNVNLGGWFLTDNRNSLNLWSFPDMELPAGTFMIVFASARNRRDPDSPLHTSFSLSGSGDYLALVRPDGVTIEQEFAPAYPPQSARFSYGFPMNGPWC